MKLGGDYTFAAPQDVVWDALLDPEVLASVLPGCERLERTGENEYEGQLHIKIGPVQGTFAGKVKLADITRPSAYSMTIDGRGAPGFVKADARLALAAEGGATHLTYDSDAQVGGRIASVGQRLLESSARAIVKQSLEGLNAAIAVRAAAPAGPSGGASGAGGAGGGSAPAHDGAGPTAAMPPSGAAPATGAPATGAPPLPKPPSQAAFAVSVAKEVAKDLVPRGMRRAIFVIVLLLIILFLLQIFSR